MLQSLRSLSTRTATALCATATGHARIFVLLVLLATLALGWYTARNLGINTDTDEMLDPDLRFLAQDREVERLFPTLDNLIVVVVDAPGLARANQVADQLAERLRARGEALGEVYRPGGGPFFARQGLLYLEPEALWALNDELAEAEPFLGTLARDTSLRGLLTLVDRALTNPLDPAAQQRLGPLLERMAASIRAQARGEPAALSWLDTWSLGPETGGAARAFILTQAAGGAALSTEALAVVREVLAGSGFGPGVRTRITGAVAMETEELVNVAEDARYTTALAFVLVLVMLLAAFRSLRTTLALLLTLAAGLVWTGAFATAAIGSLNLISVSFAVLFIGMGVDFGIQFTMRYRERLGGGAAAGPPALVEAAGATGAPLSLAALIAACSFLAFTPTDYRGLAELGVISAFSMLIALTASLTLLPALLESLRVRRFRASSGPGGLRPLGRLVPRHRRALAGLGLLTLLAGGLFAPRAHFDFNPLNLRDPTTESVATFKDLLADPGASPYTIDILQPSLAEAGALAERLEALPEVDRALTLNSYLPGGQEEKLYIIADMRTVLQSLLLAQQAEPPRPEENRAALQSVQRALAELDSARLEPALAEGARALRDALQAGGTRTDAELQGLQDALVGDFPQLLERLRSLLRASPVSLDDLPQALSERYVAADGQARIEVFPAEDTSDNRALRRFVRAVQTLTPDVSGSPVSLLEGGEVVIRACLQATLLALAATVLLTLLTLGRFSDALLALVPVLLAMCATVAGSVLLALPFNLANIIALPLLIGLANAYGIYVVTRVRAEGDVPGLFASSTPSAVLFSGLTTMASFGTLALARHPGMSQMGILVALALGFALLFALLVLPALVALRAGGRRAPTG